ncbi:pyridoxal phosphate-dependent aminotransferase [Risungbinella massiliensis]|uniref:pyridoxal phosphate-dependent aminotransferase n=1 Tax=Risungbinella massiliensis TaxID=1329796 RepID=UPI00069B88D5|nr:histidinol-phosphate transaminase [Risungbinella massiliensis]
MILLNSNESYRSPLSSEEIGTIVQQAEINRYPSAHLTNFLEAYANFFQLPVDNLLARNGSDEWIQQICLVLGKNDQPILMLEPDFTMYRVCAEQAGRRVVSVPADSSFSFSLEKILETIQTARPALFFLSNPHNPTGQLFPIDWIKQCAQAMEQVGGYLILDEAYYGFDAEETTDASVDWLSLDHVIRLRTMSKSFGMAGLRVGIAIATQSTRQLLQQYELPFPINHLSLAIATELLRQKSRVTLFWKEQCEMMDRLEAILQKVVIRTPELKMLNSYANYFFLYGAEALPFAQYCEQNGFRLRLFPTESLRECCRISLMTPQHLLLFQSAIERWQPNETSYSRS